MTGISLCSTWSKWTGSFICSLGCFIGTTVTTIPIQRYALRPFSVKCCCTGFVPISCTNYIFRIILRTCSCMVIIVTTERISGITWFRSRWHRCIVSCRNGFGTISIIRIKGHRITFRCPLGIQSSSTFCIFIPCLGARTICIIIFCSISLIIRFTIPITSKIISCTRRYRNCRHRCVISSRRTIRTARTAVLIKCYGT